MAPPFSLAQSTDALTVPNTRHNTHDDGPGYFVRRAGKPLPGVPTLLGLLFQFEESVMLWVMIRSVLVPYQYIVQRDDASENQVCWRRCLLLELND